MRKTLIAMLGLVALGLWALPALAVNSGPDLNKDLPMLKQPIPLENRPEYQQRLVGGNRAGTLSGTLINNSAAATTKWYLYPGSCTERNAGTWDILTSPKSNPVADSLNTYSVGTLGPYEASDQSLSEILWNVTTGGTDVTAPIVLNGTHSLWCGKYDANWPGNKFGYPNLTYQILYLNTGVHGGNWTLAFKHKFSAEQNYDYIYLIGGESGADPIGNDRSKFDAIIGAGGTVAGAGSMLVSWTGSITSSLGTAGSPQPTSSPVNVIGGGGGFPPTLTSYFTIAAAHQALYVVFQSDCLWSNEDNLWPDSHGNLMDDITVAGVALYTDEASAGVADPDHGGIVLKGTLGAQVIAARVPPGAGKLWQLAQGANLPTPDICNPKNTSSDLMFLGVNSSTYNTVPGQYNSIVTCTFPIPDGTASVWAQWDVYQDLPSLEGYVRQSEYRTSGPTGWSGWDPTNTDRTVSIGAAKAWFADGDEIGGATQADSIQIRYNLQCIPFFSLDQQNCGSVQYGLLYDNLRLEITTGVPAPIFGIFSGALPQSTFIDGTLAADGVKCLPATVAAGQCWPGVRGSDLPAPPPGSSSAAVHDNFNSAYGDSINFSLVTGLRTNGRGMNWKQGFSRQTGYGLVIAATNPNFVSAYDAPRVIYRIFDPATTTWSPWDSSVLDADGVSITGPVGAQDTVLTDSDYRMNWPFRDKAGTSFASNGWGSWKLGTATNYPLVHPSGSGGGFLPRGARMQYYFKAVDLLGGKSYAFSGSIISREVEELPLLPCQTGDAGCVSGGAQPGNHNSIVAPDIVEFVVLPRVYPAGTAGTLLAGRTDTPILDLDGSYGAWSYSTHATVQALRAMGVRFDRYRMQQGGSAGAHIGGHEFAGRRAGRLSNYFPNMDEYGIKDLLAGWYKIMIQSNHTSTVSAEEAQDADLIEAWWKAPTDGTNGGDRCLFASGDNYFNALLSSSGAPANVLDLNRFATEVFGVATAVDQTSVTQGAGSTLFPYVRDLFADPAAGPALGTPGAYWYQIDASCPAPNRFDTLLPVGGGAAAVSATYNNLVTSPTLTDGAAVMHMKELDTIGDADRSKALGYGFSIQFIPSIEARSQILYKFLTSCRGPRSGADLGTCWPCPTAASPQLDAIKYGEWVAGTGAGNAFQTTTYGPLYAIQDGTTRVLTGVGGGNTAAPALNRISGNFPNPFNPETAIRFTAASSGRVEVRIYDVAGRLVQTLSKSNVQAGVVNEVRWNGKSKDGADLASGIYFVKMRYPDGREDGLGHKVAIVR